MITYRRPAYVRRTLPDLLAHADERMRVWLWHNGDDAETLDVVRSHADHPRVHRFHHSVENVRLREPTNWLWQEAEGDYVAKVDDDCLLEPGWAHRLAAAMDENPQLAVLGSWRFQDEDFVPELAHRKIGTFGRHQVLQNFWVQGSGHLVRRRCIEEAGVLRPGWTFTQYCRHLALAGWTNGWLYPFVREDHMDDPRSPNSPLRTDDDLLAELPLSAQRTGVRTLADWAAQLQRSARIVQMASIDRRDYRGWRKAVRAARRRAGIGLEVPLMASVRRLADQVPEPLAQSY